MRRLTAIAVATLVGCSASPKSVKSADQRAIEDLDNAFTDHIEKTALPRTVATQAGFKAQLSEKVDSMQVLERAYVGFRNSKDPAVAAYASRRLGQLYLNTGCEVATLEITMIDNPLVKPVAEEQLAETASPILERATAFFAEAAAVTNGGEHAAESREIAAAMREADLQQVCVSTAAHWEAPRRPKAAVATKTESGVLKETCDSALTIFGGPPNTECFPQFKARCAEGDAMGCEQVGHHHLHAGALEAAREAFVKSCDLGGNCLAVAALSVPSQKEAYLASCRDGAGLGCLQLGRLLDTDDSTIKQCSSAGVPDEKKAMSQCESGDPVGCWARAGQLASKAPIELPKHNAGLLGGLGIRGPGEETPEQRRERLTRECREERSWSCISLASEMKEAGEDPTATLRDACKHGRAGCDVLATHLLEQDDETKTAEAVDLLTKNCVADWSSSCSTAAELYAKGQGAPKSSACAAAMSWRICEPTRAWECHTVNRVFGHDQKPKK